MPPILHLIARPSVRFFQITLAEAGRCQQTFPSYAKIAVFANYRQ